MVEKADHLVRKDGGSYDSADFTAHPEEYTSTFADTVSQGQLRRLDKYRFLYFSIRRCPHIEAALVEML